jgi:hypothetical protein
MIVTYWASFIDGGICIDSLFFYQLKLLGMINDLI